MSGLTDTIAQLREMLDGDATFSAEKAALRVAIETLEAVEWIQREGIDVLADDDSAVPRQVAVYRDVQTGNPPLGVGSTLVDAVRKARGIE